MTDPSTRQGVGITSALRVLNGPAADGGSVRKHSSHVLSNVVVKAVFWGSEWFQRQTPTAGQVLWAIRTILMSPYMSGLAQYGVGGGSLDPEPRFTGFDADPPQGFTSDDIRGMLAKLFTSQQLDLANAQLLPVVFTPVDIKSDDTDARGYHSWSFFNQAGEPGRLAPYAWVGNNGTLDLISAVFSHELAEATTDPYGDAVYGDPGSCGQSGLCEISDYCYGNRQTGASGSFGGVQVSAYWSVGDGRCLLPRERSVPGHVRGNPALIQGRFLSPGNFELVTPLAEGGLAHYSRVNVDPALPWYGPEVFGTDVGTFDAVTMIQSNFSAGGPGNLEVVAGWSGGLLFFWREDVPPYVWHGPDLFPLNAPGSGTVTGNPSMIQGRFGGRGNFELVTPLADGGIAHYWRDNDVLGLPWHGPTVIFGQDVGVFDAVSLIQSDFRAGGGAGNLEVIARFGSQLLHYWRADVPPFSWFGPEVVPLSAPGHNAGLVSGVPSLIQSRFGPFLKGYFDLVTPLADGGLALYTRDNNEAGLPWNGPEIFGSEVGAVDAVSLIQSTFSSSNSGVGNLEMVGRLQGILVHFWREDVDQVANETDFSTECYGPWIVTQ
jgi:hypothetical protein